MLAHVASRTLLAAALLVSSASAQRASESLTTLPLMPEGMCAPQWEAAFGAEPGAGHPNYVPPVISCAAVFDDGLGDGEVLFIGGRFETIAGQPAGRFARWDGSEWTVLPELSFTAWDMVVYDDGGGDALFIAGEFTSADGMPVNHIVKFDGVDFHPLGTGCDDNVWDLEVWEIAPSMEVLVLGGQFDTAGGVAAERLATWDGTTFAPLGDGVNNTVQSLEVHPPGPGGLLYAGGSFTASGATPLSRIAVYDGTNWQDIDGGVLGTVRAMKSWFVGGEQKLFVAGNFGSVGTAGLPVDDIATWNIPFGWEALEPITTGTFSALEVYDDGSGEALYCAGNFIDAGAGNQNCAKWDGAAWSPVGTGVDGSVFDLVVHDDGSGSSLWFTGQYFAAGSQAMKSIARWDGAWNPVGTGLSAHVIETFYVSSINGSRTLYMGGYFSAPTLTSATNLVGWSDGAWVSLGEVVGSVYSIVEHNDGSGNALYVGGDLVSIDGVPFDKIARWDGTTWTDVGGGMDSRVKTMTVHDDGTGPALYAAGQFTDAGGTPAARIAKWDGTTWSPLGAGLGTFAVGEDLISWDDGTGSALYVAGAISTASGGPAEGIARWDGTSWSPLNTGLLSGGGRALEVFDDGTGEKLYIGGDFSSADGVADTREIAAWDGTSWHAVGPGLTNFVNDLAVYDDGNGLALYAGGAFTGTWGFGTPMSFAGRWDGSTWSPLGDGLNSQVLTMTTFDDGSGHGPRLAVGGRFTAVHDLADSGGASNAAMWGGCWDGVSAWTDLGFSLLGELADPPLLVGTGSLAYGSINTLNLSSARASALAGLFLSLSSTPTPFAGGTLVPFPPLPPILVTTSALGTVPIDYEVDEVLLSGVTIYAQWVIDDPMAIAGYSMSNAVVGVTP